MDVLPGLFRLGGAYARTDPASLVPLQFIMPSKLSNY